MRLGLHRADPDRRPVAGRGEVLAVGGEAERLDRAGELAEDQAGTSSLALPAPAQLQSGPGRRCGR